MCSIILCGTALKLAAQDQTMQICKVAHLSNVSVKMQVIIYSKCYILHCMFSVDAQDHAASR